MFRRIALLLLCACAGVAHTVQQSPPGQQGRNPDPNAARQIKPEDRCTIEGTVSSLKTGQPLAKAEVRLRKADGNSPAGYAATSDSSGRYVVEEIDPGKYLLSISRNGYVTTAYGSDLKKRSATLITLVPAQHMTKVDIKLPPQAVVTGRIVDEGNEPLANITVQLMSRAYQNGKRSLEPGASATTNDKGEYRIFGVAPGKYWALAHLSSMTMQQSEVRASKKDQAAYPATYYPGGLSLTEASPLQLVAGAELDGIDFHLAKVRSFTISGKLVSPGGGHNSSVQLMPHDADGAAAWDRMKFAMADDEGKYAFHGVQPGRYELTANSFYSENRSSAHAEAVVSDNDVDVPLDFGQNPDLHGVIRSDDPSDIIKPGINVMLQAEGGMGAAFPSEIKEDGTFTLKSVSAERLRLLLFPLPAGHYIKAVQLGNVEVDDTMLDLTNGAPGELAITLSAKGAVISGIVQDDQQKFVTSATIVLVPDNRKLQSRYLTASPDQNGQFIIKDVPPGSYKLFAFDNAEHDIWLDSDWLKAYETKGESIEVKELEKATKKLVLIATDES